MSSRSRLILTLLASVLLHAALLAVLWQVRSVSPPPRAASTVVELEVISPPERPAAPPASKPAGPPSPRPSAEPARQTQRHALPAPGARKTEEASAAPSASPAPPVAQRTDKTPEPEGAMPRAQDVPRAAPPLTLLPKNLPGGVAVEEPPSRGHTVHNAPGETPDEEAVAAYQAEEAKARVDGWVSDTLATARARRGAPAPYYRQLQVSFSEQLVDPPPPNADVVGSRLAREQVESVQRFGKTGSPWVPPEQRDHRIEQRNRLQAAVEAGRATNMFMVDVTAPVLALAAVVEVWQEPTGGLRDLKLLESSGDPTFDSWAISRLRNALAKASSPPDAGVGIHEDGIRTRWRLEEYLGNPRVQIHLLGIY